MEVFFGHETKDASIEPTVHLREADHRVANSLQLVSSLLALQERIVEEQQAREALQDARRRIACIARLHKQLCSGATANTVQLDDYLMSEGDDLRTSFLEGRGIQLLVNVDPTPVTSELASTIGLVVSELVINTIKHDFCGDTAGTIEIIGGLRENGTIEIELKSFSSPPTSVRFLSKGKASGIGLKIVAALLKQHRATLETATDAGSAVHRIVFPRALRDGR